MFVSFFHGITGLPYTYGCATFRAPYVLSSILRITESHYTYELPTLTAAYYRITELHYIHGCASLRQPTYVSVS